MWARGVGEDEGSLVMPRDEKVPFERETRTCALGGCSGGKAHDNEKASQWRVAWAAEMTPCSTWVRVRVRCEGVRVRVRVMGEG